VRARRQASPAGDCRRPLGTLVDQTQSRDAPRGRGRSKRCTGSGGLRVVDAGKSRRASRMALSALSACQAHMGGNDLMAFGAMTAWEKRGGKPGADAWFSGINTSTEALE